MTHTAPQTTPDTDLPRPEFPACRIYPQQVLRAAELIELILNQNLPSDRVLQHAFRAERKLGKRDRLLLQALVFFVLRHWRLLNSLTHQDPPTVLAQLGMTIKLAGQLDERLGELTGVSVETPILLDHDLTTQEHPDSLAERLSLTDDDLKRLTAAFGQDAESVGRALLDRAPLDLRVNPLKTTREALLETLQAEGIEAEPIEGLPLGIRVAGSPALTGLAAYGTGLFEIQDAGSQWILAACQTQEGDAILDLCAGAGGKALGLAAEVGDSGRVLACDIAAERLERLPERSQRAGLGNIECQPITSGTDPALTRRGPFDRVLIDAPCSGSGTFRRHPELKQAALDLPALCAVQSQLLDEGAALTRVGGLLVYATCSLWREENETQIEEFLARHPGWRISPLPEHVADHVQIHEGMARVRPDLQGSDGFFFAALQAPDA